MKRTTCIAKTFAVIVLLGALTAGCTHDEVREETTPKTAAPSTSTEATATIAKEDTLLSAMPTTLDLHPDVRVKVSKGKAFVMQLDGMMLAAVDSAVLHDGTYTATALHEGELPKLPSDHVNVTAGSGAGYRLLPGGEHFSPYAELRVAYDEGKLPKGYTPDDIHTSYYDTETGVWTRLVRKEVDTLNKEIVSLTTHFTDFVNEVLKAPEMPETQAFVPTAISELEAANPLEGLTLIQPPAANNSGTANLSYPLQIPAGRQGMQPNLALTYNSGGGNGWLGVGWDLSVPSISVETRWGVPRYNQSYESEIYLLNGEQLVSRDREGHNNPMPHRVSMSDWLPRMTGSQRFFYRVGDVHDSIVRHGNAPNEYWWEVIDRNGITYYYGKMHGSNSVDQGSVLCAPNGNIAHWALTETKDPNGNTILYYYDKVWHYGVEQSAAMGCQLYLERINYTGYNGAEGAYDIEFVRDPQDRRDIITTANYGFKVVTASALCHINVRYDDTVRVQYYFIKDNNRNSLYKTRLRDIRCYDEIHGVSADTMTCGDNIYGNPDIAFVYHFDYYDYPSQDSLFSGFVYGEAYDDKIRPDGILLNADPDAKATALGATKGRSWSLGGAASVGLGANVCLSSASLGGNFDYGKSENIGLLTMADLNGDGLADKVFKKGDDVFYRPQIPTRGKVVFSNRYYKVMGINNFLIDNSTTPTWGAQISVGLNGSASWPTTNSTTTTYFTDINGDGLTDLVTEQGPLFNNGVNEAGNPVFRNYYTVSASGDRSDPKHDTVAIPATSPCGGGIIYDGEVDPEIACRYYYDTVHRKCANLEIDLNNLIGSGKVIVSIDTANGFIYYHDTIPSRMECGPVTADSNLDAVKVWVAPFDGKITLYDTIQLLEDSSPSRRQSRYADGVHYIVQHSKGCSLSANVVHANTSTIITQGQIDEDDYQESISVNSGIRVQAGDLLFFRLNSIEDRRFDNVYWRHRIVYTSRTSPQQDDFGLSDDSYYFPKDYVLTGDYVFQANGNGTVTIEDDIHTHTLNRPIQYRICLNNTTIYSPSLTSNSHLSVNQSFPVSYGDNIRIDVTASSNTTWSEIECHPQLVYNGTLSGITGNQTVEYYLVAQLKIDYNNTYWNTLLCDHYRKLFGTLYRGWGQFTYKNGDPATDIIDVTHLLLPEYVTNASSCSTNVANTNLSSVTADDIQNAVNNVYNPLSVTSGSQWVEMTPDGLTESWVGFGRTTHITRSLMSNTREETSVPIESGFESGQIEDYEHPVPVVAGGHVKTIRKQTRNKLTNLSEGTPMGVVCSSGAEGSSDILTDYMDLNGDRYPDVIGSGSIQYTTPSGGIGSRQNVRTVSDFLTSTSTISNGSTFGASYPIPTRMPSHNPKTAKVSTGGQGNMGVSIGSGVDYTDCTLLDINGDGLPDLVRSDGHVYLNVGYGFLPLESWNSGNIRYGSSSNNSASSGGGFSVSQYSISGGASLNSSENYTNQTLMDFNGDGLPDKLYTSSNGLSVSYNFGNGSWSGTETIRGLGPISHSVSYSEAANASVTAGFTAWSVLKITASVQSSPYNRSFSKDCEQIIDIDGDGYPDYVVSKKEDDIAVRYNQAGRTNLLRRVVNFSDATIEMTYDMPLSSFEKPQRSWHLASVTTSDALTSYKPTKTTFEYRNPHYDRYERIEFGYDTVITVQYDTDHGNVPYRKTIEGYHNRSLSKRGQKSSETICDANGNPYVETLYSATVRDRITDATVEDDCADEVYVSYEAEIHNYYEGASSPTVTTMITREYDKYHNITKFTDHGDITRHSEYYSVEVDYLGNASYNLISLPVRVKVYDYQRNLLRHRTAQYDNRGRLTQLTHYNNGSTCDYNYVYDTYGNIKKVVQPTDDNGDRMEYNYVYDPVVHAFPIHVGNSLGYYSEAQYNYYFGKPTLVTDIGGNSTQYSYDWQGRIINIIAPKELASGASYTIHMEYRPYINMLANHHRDNHYAYALTKHWDYQDTNNPICTVVLCNGWGQVVQTKKDCEVNGTEQWMTSGFTEFDCFGRTTKQYMPNLAPLTDPCSTYVSTPYGTPTITSYDILDRKTSILQPLNVNTYIRYGFATRGGSTYFKTTTTDGEGRQVKSLAGSRQQQILVTAPEHSVTTFEYNPLGELIHTIDPAGNETYYEYDMLGQRVSRLHPDAGLDVWTYDNAGHMTSHATQQLNDQNTIIKYIYNFNQLVEVQYPQFPFNNTTYWYGYRDEGNDAGRVTKIKDGSGVQNISYGNMGEVVKIIRTFALPYDDRTYTFDMEFSYDSWNRMQSISYPDGEVVQYHYNSGGDLDGVDGTKNGIVYPYINDIVYNRFGKRNAVFYGNGTEVRYEYDDLQRLNQLVSTDAQSNVMQNVHYTFDRVSNIVNISNSSMAINNMGGDYNMNFIYDDLDRLVESGSTSDGYGGNSLWLTYSPDGRIGGKIQNTVSTSPFAEPLNQDCLFGYYANGYQPHAVRRIVNAATRETYDLKWDANGNLAQVDCYSEYRTLENSRFLFWNENNCLSAVVDNRYCSYYGYDHEGERTLKLTGENTVMDMNAQVQSTFALLDNLTLYTSPYLVATNHGYTKHYYAGTERLCAKIGSGGLDHDGTFFNGDCAHTPIAIEQQDNPCLETQEFLNNATHLFDETLHELANRELDGNDPLEIYDIEGQSADFLQDHLDHSPQSMDASAEISLDRFHQSMEGAAEDQGIETELYFYHSDHLGSGSWITNANGDPVQHLQYLPYGEPFVNHRISSYNERFTFTGKERDEETGYGYFGARYMDHELMTMWLNVDPLADKYPSISPYAYCAWNPVKLIDPDGRDVWEIDSKGNIVSRTEDKTRDAFYMVNSKGERLEDAYIEFDYGTVTQTKTLSLDGGSYDMYQIKGDDNGTSLFEFLADNSEVEWSHIKTGKEGGNAQNFITTSHSDNEERGGYHLWKNRLKYGYTVREMNHSHPSGIPIPSGMPGTDQSGKGDISFATTISRHYNGEGKNLPIFNVYNCNGGYVQYSQSSVVSDYSKTMELYGVTFINGQFYR